MMSLTSAQGWLHHRNTWKAPCTRPSLLANHIDRAFNCVAHDPLIEILTHCRLVPELVRTIASFSSKRSIFMSFDGEEEGLVAFKAGLPQGSPLSPILFVIYAAWLSRSPAPSKGGLTTYVDDEVMTQGARDRDAATVLLHQRLDARIKGAKFLNIRFSSAKAELMHLNPPHSQQDVGQGAGGHPPLRRSDRPPVCYQKTGGVD